MLSYNLNISVLMKSGSVVFHSISEGRPKLRWKDSLDQDMRILGVKNWKKVALNRDEWAKLLKKARALQGLSSQ
jgi:hypothetical protein